MTKEKTPIVPFILSVFFLSLLLTGYAARYIKTSFKVDSNGNAIRLINFCFINCEEKDILLEKNLYFQNPILKDSGYAISFYIKTLAERALFFNTSSDSGGGSIYWNIYILDGRIQTARLGSLPSVLTDKKINDGEWHHVFISVGKEQKVFIDEELESRIIPNILYLPDFWFNFYLEPTADNTNLVSLKDILFVNKPISLRLAYRFHEKGGETFSNDVFTHFLIVLAGIFSAFLLLIGLIKRKYPHEFSAPIIRRVLRIWPVLLLCALSLWTPYREKAIFCGVVFFSHYLARYYREIFPKSIGLFIFSSLSFFIIFGRLVRQKNYRKLKKHLFFNKPQAYYFVLIFLSALLIF